MPGVNMNNQELILSTIKKVYAIRESVERRSRDEGTFRGIPLLGDVAYKLSSDAMSRDQIKDISAFVTATCPTFESLMVMERISGFKSKLKVKKPLKVWLSYFGLIIPILVVILIEAYMVYLGIITEMPYILITIGLIIAGIIVSILLFAYLGYDKNYRRDYVENLVWKAIHNECEKRIRKGAQQKRLTGGAL
jgi:uncharacterized protein YacL